MLYWAGSTVMKTPARFMVLASIMYGLLWDRLDIIWRAWSPANPVVLSCWLADATLWLSVFSWAFIWTWAWVSLLPFQVWLLLGCFAG